MSEVTSGPDAVSALEEDSLEYQTSAADVMSAASNFAKSPTYPLKSSHSSTHYSNQLSLQELIEAELNSRLAPLQPDSLEGGPTDFPEHIQFTAINGDVTTTCTSLLDSLETSPFSLDSLIDVESGVDLTLPAYPTLGGSPPSPHLPFSHNSSCNKFDNKHLNYLPKAELQSDSSIREEQDSSDIFKLPGMQRATHLESVNVDVIKNSLPRSQANVSKNFKSCVQDEADDGSFAKTENLTQDFSDSNKILKVTDATNIEVKDIAEMSDIILIEEDDNIGNAEHIVVENISFEINANNDTIVESHCIQDCFSNENVINGFEQKIDQKLLEQKLVVKQIENLEDKKLNFTCNDYVNDTSEILPKSENIMASHNGTSESDIHDLEFKYLETLSLTSCDGADSQCENIVSSAYDLTTNNFHDFEQPEKTTLDKYYQADSFSDFKISSANKSVMVDNNINNYQQSGIVDSKINNVDSLGSLDHVKDSNKTEPPSFDKLNNFSQSLFDDNKFNNFDKSETLPMETNHKLIRNIIDVSNSYNIIDVINNKDVGVYNNSLLPADVHVTNMDESELWPEEEDKKDDMDEFQKMEQEMEKELEEEQTKKKKSDTDKRGKKKKKRKGESEKENKELSPYLLNNSFSSNEKVDCDDITDDEKDTSCLNGHHSPFAYDEQNRVQLTPIEDDGLANISVKQLVGTYASTFTPASATHATSSIQTTTSNVTACQLYPSDFTPGVTFKTLKSTYEASAQKRPSPCAFPIKDEVHVSFMQLRDAYCNVASNSPREGNSPTPRSTTTLKTPSTFRSMEPTQVSNDCRICGKQVFQMEKIVAEKASWHKNCFRCIECNKNLTLETYQSHEGSLYCKPHFKELFRPKAVILDEAEERKDRLLRRPRMIILESQPDALPDDVVRATNKPDYGLEELQTSLNVKERFAVFENYSKGVDEPKLEPASVRRSQSLMSKAARFSNGHENGDFEGDDEEFESGEEGWEEEKEGDEEDPNYVKSRKKKERPMSFSGMGDLKAVWEQKQRREEMSQARKEDISKFRQMLCAGKNITLKEMFESGNFEGADEEEKQYREEIKIEERRAAHNLKARFEKGQPFILEDEEGSEDGSRTSTLIGEKQEVEEVFKDAQTAKQARNVFKQIDTKVSQEGSAVLRSPSFATQNRDNRRSLDISLMMSQKSTPTVEVVKSSEPIEEELQMDTTDLANRFKFFATFEEREREEKEKKRKVFRITPPREGAEQVEDELLKANIKPCMAPNCTVCKLRGLTQGNDNLEVLGRNPNLIKCTDNYQDEIDCRNTKNILQMFKKMEMGQEDLDDEGPRPLKCFTPPPEDGEGDYSEYSDEDYSDEGEDDESEDDQGKPKFKDELLEMSAKKAANLRAKFEKWEAEVERQNELNRSKDGELTEECRPSLDTARNLKAMFEHKAIETTKPVTSKPVAQKINRFVGNGEKCMTCNKTVYAMEKLEIHGKILHKNCFKCFKCNTRLSVGSFSIGGDQMFCTTHYKQLFTEKGSYNAFLSGKDKWTSKIEATNAEAIKSHD